MEDVSFVFVLKWFQHELRLSKDKRSSLLKHMEETTPINASELPKLKTEKELLTMCYFQYLESRKFLGANKDYLYG